MQVFVAGLMTPIVQILLSLCSHASGQVFQSLVSRPRPILLVFQDFNIGSTDSNVPKIQSSKFQDVPKSRGGMSFPGCKVQVLQDSQVPE